MSLLDLEALARAAAEQVATCVLRELPQMVRAVLDEREREALLDSAGAAAFLGLSPGAFKMRRRRAPALDRLALGAGRFRRWRRADLEAYLREQGRHA